VSPLGGDLQSGGGGGELLRFGRGRRARGLYSDAEGGRVEARVRGWSRIIVRRFFSVGDGG